MKIWKDIKWNKLPWAEIELSVFNLQMEIFKQSKLGNTIKVNQLQKEFVKLEASKLLAVRRITQDNQGKATAGIDEVKNVEPKNRYALIDKLIFNGHASKIRRVYIPKSNGKLRPLGIPTIVDRCKQMLMKMALEPEWEAKFEDNVYAFRPGYSAFDAKHAVTRQIQGRPKFFLDADIKGCFDNIGHIPLLTKLNTIPMFRAQIKAWLEAGILDDFKDASSDQNEVGTPQGGVISPLLCNIALHGLETTLMNEFPRDRVKIIRYADDFVVTGAILTDIIRAKWIVIDFLKTVNLELSEEKTRIGHSLETLNFGQGNILPGLDFLGYHFRNYHCSIHRGVKTTRGQKQPFIQVSMPSQDAFIKHKQVLRKILREHRTAPREALINKLSQVIQGWTRYYAITKCSKYFSYIDRWLFWRLWFWAVKRYKGAHNAYKKCFNVKGWSFGFVSGDKTFILRRHSQTRTIKYVKIKAGASIYSGEILYFCKRMSLHNTRIKRLNNLMKNQNYKCSLCKTYFLPNDLIELHHDLDPQGIRNGKMEFLHRHCHDLKHAKTADQ